MTLATSHEPAPRRVETSADSGNNLVGRARPYFGLIVLTVTLLTAWGLYSMWRMPSGIYPEVSFPQIVVIAESAGLGVREVEISITRPIEERISAVLGVARVRSKTIRAGAELKIDFTPGTDMVQALNDIRAKLAEARATFPAGTVTDVERQSPSIFPIISFVVTGGKDPTALHDYAFYDLRPRLGRLDDVAFVTVQGGDVREILIEIDPQRLVETGLSLADVSDRIGKEHRLKAVGRLDRGSTQFQVVTDHLAVDPQQLERQVIAVKNNQSIRLGDIGRVVVSHEDRSMAIRANGHDAVALTVFRRLGGNALTVKRELDAALVVARTTAPAGVNIVPVYDQGDLVRTAIENVRDAILIGGALSVLILLLFLKSVRATLIASLSIPLSLIITFVFLRLTGDTLNLMSLGGLAVAIGLIIDDAVVVVENIARHLAAGEQGDVAIDRASKEISGAVVGSTLTTILVFVPLAFVHGVVGQFFQSLSLSLSIALLVSMVISLTIIPVLAAKFLTAKAMPESGPIYNFLAERYERVLRLGLRVPRLMLVLSLLMALPAWWLIRHLDSGFMPAMDEGAFILDYEMPVGTSLAQTDRVLRKVEGMLQQMPDVAGYIRRTGAENGLFATEAFRGDILVSLKPAGQRRRLPEIFDDVRKQVVLVAPELDNFEPIPLIQDQLNDMAGLERMVEVKIFGPDPAKLRELADDVQSAIGKRFTITQKAADGQEEKVDDPQRKLHLKDVNSHARLGNPDLVVKPNALQIARVGLTMQDVENQLTTALYGQVATTLPQQDRITNIRVRFPDSVRFDRQRLEQLPISLTTGGSTNSAATTPAGSLTTGSSAPGFVPLGQLASIELQRTPNEFWRENQQPVITVTAEPASDQDLGAANRELALRLNELVKFPPGYRWELAGSFKAQQDSFTSLLIVLMVASAMVFLLLGFQFHSLTLPILIFLTQPVSLASAMFALWITGTPLNVSSFMGAILLIGLDVKNGIILIEYIGQLCARGVPLSDALVQAGRTRFRPILMTSLMSIFGLLPLALGLGPGAQMQQPLAIAVIGGLVANMLFTRLLIPVGYLVLRGGAAQGTAADRHSP